MAPTKDTSKKSSPRQQGSSPGRSKTSQQQQTHVGTSEDDNRRSGSFANDPQKASEAGRKGGQR
ncbi:MAG: stress-induced protein [Pseudolabrys sp.]|nr:stress-induced protein [Pseudolabrys sp.]